MCFVWFIIVYFDDVWLRGQIFFSSRQHEFVFEMSYYVFFPNQKIRNQPNESMKFVENFSTHPQNKQFLVIIKNKWFIPFGSIFCIYVNYIPFFLFFGWILHEKQPKLLECDFVFRKYTNKINLKKTNVFSSAF